MPHQPTVAENRLSNTIASLTPIVTLLNEINDAFGPPFILAISNTTLSLITAVQNVKRNKDECIQLMENTHQILYAVINLHMNSETAGSLPPATLYHVGRFTETLHEIHTFVEAAQDGNKIKHFFRQREMNTLLKDCQAGLEEALKFFKVETGLLIPNNIAEMQKKTHDMHQELLELVESLSDGTTSDRSSSIYQSTTGSKNSSNSLLLLPAQPKIFHGRQLELEDIVKSLSQESAHIAILGAGGIGKTSLARAAIHHPQVATKYENRFFIPADSATTSVELAALTGSHLGLKPGKNLTKAVVQFLSRGPPCLLVIDNLETPWESQESRGGVEEFLSLLTDIPHLALIITMRGAERPAKVQWTRPFLKPLQTLSYEAAWQTFIEIADDFHDTQEIDQLLRLTDNLPLAVDLIAHLVDYEGCPTVLTRWEMEKTSLLSGGHDHHSNLDASIVMSLASPRMTSCPGAEDLLSLLSILPDGLSDAELMQSNLPIKDPLGCRATLIRTSLAYSDDKNRLKSLVPIREHIQSFSPPSQPLFHPLCKHFQVLMDLYDKYHGLRQNHATINQISSNIGNLHQLLLLELHSDNPDLTDVINCTLSLSTFLHLSGHTPTALMDYIPAVLPQLCDHRIEAKYVIENLRTLEYHPNADPESLIHQGMAHFQHFNDPLLEASFYSLVGYYYERYKNDVTASAQSWKKALSLARLSGDSRQISIALSQRAWLKQRELLQLCGMQGSQADLDVMVHLAEVHILKSEYLEARSIHVEVSQKASAQENTFYTAVALINIAELDVMIGADVTQVLENLGTVKTTFSSLGLARAVKRWEASLAELNLREGDTITAKNLLQQCLSVAWGNYAELVSYCLERLADISRWTSHNMSWPYKWTVIYLAQAQKTHNKLALHRALRCVGDVFLSEGDEHTAHNLFVVALEGFTHMDVHRSRADCMIRLGDITRHQGDLVKAAELWRQARSLFEWSSQAKDVAQIDTRLASIQDVSDTHQETLAHLTKLEAPTISLDEEGTSLRY
ncbi:hypothetical protein C8R44DRAFT_858093 [Mycena epipterygia]|nr:hypothetical protein C8R44DRAFT_858093 [Mycena epipterygia]